MYGAQKKKPYKVTITPSHKNIYQKVMQKNTDTVSLTIPVFFLFNPRGAYIKWRVTPATDIIFLLTAYTGVSHPSSDITSINM